MFQHLHDCIDQTLVLLKGQYQDEEQRSGWWKVGGRAADAVQGQDSHHNDLRSSPLVRKTVTIDWPELCM